MRESAGRRVHAYAAGTCTTYKNTIVIVVQPPRTLNPEFGQQCSRPVTQKRKSTVLCIYNMFIFSNCIRSKSMLLMSSVRPFADDEEDQTYIPEPESNRNQKYS